MRRTFIVAMIFAACSDAKKPAEPAPAKAETSAPIPATSAPASSAAAAPTPAPAAAFDPKKAPSDFPGCPAGAEEKPSPDGSYRHCEKDGKRVGPEVRFSGSRVIALTNYANGVQEGKSYIWDDDGDLKKEMDNHEGRAAGVWREYKKGVLDGTQTYWTPQGDIDRVEIRRDGKDVTVPDPVCPAGTKLDFQREIDLSYAEKLDGQDMTIDRTGYSRKWCVRPDGKPNGPYVYYGRGMVVQEAGTFVNGVQDGKQTTYDDMGNLSEEGQLAKGKKTGAWFAYRGNGTKSYSEVYDAKGKLVETIPYDDDGKPMPKQK